MSEASRRRPGSLGAEPSVLENFWDLLPNYNIIPFLGMFLLNFCLKTFETCLLFMQLCT